jgi:hypothetical protein
MLVLSTSSGASLHVRHLVVVIALIAVPPLLCAQNPFGTTAGVQTDTASVKTLAANRVVPPDSIDLIAGKYEPEIDDDKVTGTRTLIVSLAVVAWSQHQKNLHAKCTNGSPFPLSLILGQRTTSRGRSSLAIQAEYHGKGWLFFGDEPLYLLIDDSTRMQLPGDPQPRRDVANGGVVSEEILFAVTVDELRVLARARSVDARLVGRDGYCTFSLPPGTRATIAQFLAHEHPETSIASATDTEPQGQLNPTTFHTDALYRTIYKPVSDSTMVVVVASSNAHPDIQIAVGATYAGKAVQLLPRTASFRLVGRHMTSSDVIGESENQTITWRVDDSTMVEMKGHLSGAGVEVECPIDTALVIARAAHLAVRVIGREYEIDQNAKNGLKLFAAAVMQRS